MAVKLIEIDSKRNSAQAVDYNLPHYLIREIEALCQLDEHPNVVKLLGIFRDKQTHVHMNRCFRVYLVFEFMETDLQNFIGQRHRCGLDIDSVLCFSEQLLQGLAHIHKRGFIHRDIKPGNILVNAPATHVVNGNHSKHYRQI